MPGVSRSGCARRLQIVRGSVISAGCEWRNGDYCSVAGRRWLSVPAHSGLADHCVVTNIFTLRKKTSDSDLQSRGEFATIDVLQVLIRFFRAADSVVRGCRFGKSGKTGIPDVGRRIAGEGFWSETWKNMFACASRMVQVPLWQRVSSLQQL